MKRTRHLILAGLALLATACGKKTNTTPGTTTANLPNRITVVDNGKSHTITGVSFWGGNKEIPDEYVDVSITKYTDNSTLLLSAYKRLSTSTIPFEISLEADGPLNGLGSFEIDYGTYTQLFQGGEKYNIDAGTVNVTVSESAHIKGTLSLDISNAQGNKTITGDFDINEPNLN